MIEPQLTFEEARVLGSLVEKSVTTPDNYPLSLNALINACNQKSNRDPIVEFSGQEVGEAISSLKTKGLVRIVMGGDSRVPKYQHYFEETYHLNQAESALLCELLLRGPQTPGELRGRIERFNVTLRQPEVETLLSALQARPDPLLVELPRQVGRREARVAHLLAGEPVIPEETEPTVRAPREDRLSALEAEVQALRGEMVALHEEFAAFRRQFE